MDKTVFFKSCLGVFQGGGCRAAAYAGAYEEAIRRGVSFSEVAGTSAGSILAALIGAGASPRFVREKLESLDFKRFLHEPERSGKRRPLLNFVIKKHYADLYFDQGFYSSAEIQSWMEGLLRELLPDSPHPVTFKSLPFPTYIVSTDLTKSGARIWSQETTPNEIVAQAVRASCSIPIFFQPVEKRYIDGGLVSNLPAYVFANHGRSQRSLSSKILAFALTDSSPEHPDWNTRSYLLQMINALIDGGKQLQLELQTNVHLISIDTGSIQAIDFEKMTPEITSELVEGGVRATRKFFDDERLHVKMEDRRASICFDKDEFYSRITDSLTEAIQRLIIAEHDTDWVYKLFPTLLTMRERGIEIDVLLPEHGDKSGDGPYRRRLLNGLGVNVTILSGQSFVPLRASVVIPNDRTQTRALIGVKQESKVEADSVLYQGYLDAGVLELTKNMLDSLVKKPTQPTHRPMLIKIMDDEVLSPLRTVGQYAGSDVRISVERISIADLLATSRLTREYKYNQVRQLVGLYRRLGLELFEPAAVQLANGFKSIVTPPVVEETSNGFILIEGSTRATFCRDESISSFKCVVVRGTTAPIPSQTYDFAKVRLTSRALPPSLRYEGFSYEHFRHIERAMHPIDSLE